MASVELDPRQRRLAARFGVLGNGLPIGIAALTAAVNHEAGPVFYAAAAGAAIVPLVVTLVPRERSPVAFAAAAFGGLPLLTLMQADTGGVASGYSVLLMMAMIWFGVQATDREMVVGLGVLAACLFLPMLAVGPPAYPVSWGHAAMLLLVGTAVAGSLRQLVRETRTLTHRLQRQATVDDLTGLLNRRGWNEAADARLEHARAHAEPVSLALVDLDAFKQINDTMGHDEGDRVLQETAQRLRDALPPSATIGRLGGDEFVALVADLASDEVVARLTRLSRSTAGRGRFSTGVAVLGRAETRSELLRRADVALYEAKTSHHGAVCPAPAPVDTVP